MALVSIQKTESYSPDDLRAAVTAHFKALGIANDLRADMKVLVKPNLIGEHCPERASTTHPALVAEIVRWLRENGVYDVTIADSPGGTYRRSYLKAVYEASGYSKLEGDVRLNFNTGFQPVSCPAGFLLKSFNIIDPIVGADYIINVAKLKTHALTTMTAGVKNLFGAIPGLQKPECHFKYPDIDDFCRLLVELALVVKPQVTVIDAVEAMEGNGPINGRRRKTDLTLASRDIFSQDYVVACLMGLDPQTVPILRQALKMKLFDPDAIETTGFNAQPADPSFQLPETLSRESNRSFLARSLAGVLKRVYCAVPAIDLNKCVGCGKCAESCPMKLIEIKDRKAGMSTKHCISCFCCQEMCPKDAVRVRHVFRLPKV